MFSILVFMNLITLVEV